MFDTLIVGATFTITGDAIAKNVGVKKKINQIE